MNTTLPTTVTVPLSTPGENNVLFSDMVTKINRRGRMQERWLMVTGG